MTTCPACNERVHRFPSFAGVEIDLDLAPPPAKKKSPKSEKFFVVEDGLVFITGTPGDKVRYLPHRPKCAKRPAAEAVLRGSYHE